MPFKVKCIEPGYYNHRLVQPDQVFYIKEAKDFADSWMKSLDSKLDSELAKGDNSNGGGTLKSAVATPSKVENLKFEKPVEKKPEDEFVDEEEPLEDIDEDEAKDEKDSDSDDAI